MDRYGFNQLDVMRDSGVSNSVLCLWLQRKYKGDNRKVAFRLQNWMISVQRREERRQALAAGGGVTEAALAAAPGGTLAAASSATPRAVPLYAYAPVSSYGHGTSSKHSQHVLHEHLVPIRLQYTMPQRPAAATGALNGSSSAAAAAGASVQPHDSASTYSDCFLWNLFEQQLSPRAFLSQTLADEGMDVALWLPPLLEQMKEQLAHFVATEPQRKENLEEWPQLMMQYGVTNNAPPNPATASTVCRTPPAPAAAAAVASSSSSPSTTPSAGAPTLQSDPAADRPPSAVGATLRGSPSERTLMLPTFVCGAVSSVPPLAARDPANNWNRRNVPSTHAHITTNGSNNPNTAAPMQMDPAGESSSSSAAAASATRAHPDVSLLHQDPAGVLTRQPTPQLVKLKFDLTHNGTHLLYHVLWDPSNPHCIPEDFSRVVCKELGLSGDFAALMAWSAREQLERDERLQAQQPGRVEGCLPRVPFPPPGESLFRAEAAALDFGPIVRSVPTTTIKTEPAQQQEQSQHQQQRADAAVGMPDAAASASTAPFPAPISLASNGQADGGSLGGDITPASLSGLKRKLASEHLPIAPSSSPVSLRGESATSSPPHELDDDPHKKQRKHEVHLAVEKLLERSGVLDDTAVGASGANAAAAPSASSSSFSSAGGLPMTPLSGHGSSSGTSRLGLSLFSPGGPAASATTALPSSSPSPMTWSPLAAAGISPLTSAPLPPSFFSPLAGSGSTNTPSPRLP